MSVIVNINQNSECVKEIGLNFLEKWTASHGQFYGVPDAVYVLSDYTREEDIRNQLFILFNQKKYGRGMSFFLDENYNVEVVLNLPATQTDIEMFFGFINDFCENFDIDSFLQEGEEVTLKQIPEIKERLLQFNQTVVKENLKTGLTIFGCVYPIVLEDSYMKSVEGLSDAEKCQCFEQYLDEKQKLDCYFAKPILYQMPNKGGIAAKYALTEDVPSIFPIETYLPFGYNQNLKDEIKSWSVLLVAEDSGELKPYKELEYDAFCSLIDISSYEKFDASHVILTFNKDMRAKIDNTSESTNASKGLFDNVKKLFSRKK